MLDILGIGLAAAGMEYAWAIVETGFSLENFPNVSNNLLNTVPRDIAAQIFMGGAHLYGFTAADFEKAEAAAAKRSKLTTAAVGA